MRETLNDWQGLFNSLRPEPVDDCGAFSDEQLNERNEDTEDACANCELEDHSDCCTAPIICHDLCSSCKEHCDSICLNCDFKN